MTAPGACNARISSARRCSSSMAWCSARSGSGPRVFWRLGDLPGKAGSTISTGSPCSTACSTLGRCGASTASSSASSCPGARLRRRNRHSRMASAVAVVAEARRWRSEAAHAEGAELDSVMEQSLSCGSIRMDRGLPWPAGRPDLRRITSGKGHGAVNCPSNEFSEAKKTPRQAGASCAAGVFQRA